MAYANLVKQTVAEQTEMFKRLRDFICKRNGSYDYSTTGIGWTLHDAVYAVNQDTLTVGDYIVLYSPGEDGLQSLYFKVTYTGTGQIDTIGYLYWNNSTHAGTQGYGNCHFYTTAATSSELWVYGNLDYIFLFNRYGTTYNIAHFGWCPGSPYDQNITSAPSSIASGSSRVVSFTSVPASWIVVKYLFVRDTTNIERVLITNISGNDVTFSSFVASYAAGAKFSLMITYALKGYGGVGSVEVLIGQDGTKGATINKYSVLSNYPTTPINDTYPVIPIYYIDYYTTIGPLPNVYLMSPITGIAQESAHTDVVNSWRYFGVSSFPVVVREV